MNPRIQLTLSLITLLFFGVMAVVGFQHAKAAPPAPEIIEREELQNWQYQVVQESKDYVSARVDYSRDSYEALRQYAIVQASLVQGLRKDGIDQLFISVTFRRPLPIVEFREWAKAHNMRVDSFMIRVKSPDGRAVTVGGVPTNGQIVEDDHLQRILQRVVAHGATDVQGIFSADGVSSITSYSKISTSKEVFISDVTRSVILHRLAKKHPTIQLQAQSIIIPSPFSRMEELGLDKFQ